MFGAGVHPKRLSPQEICPDPDNARITALAALTRHLRGRIFNDIAELRLAENLPVAVAENTAEAGKSCLQKLFSLGARNERISTH